MGTEEILTEVPWSLVLQVFLDTLIPVRRDLYLDPMVGDPWCCDPARCSPLLGNNLCCKVEIRCRHLRNDRCSIHQGKPFDCSLFPLDLVRIAGIRVVTTVKNPDFFETGWCRYDRDMLRCFEGSEHGNGSMFEAQRDVLRRAFTRAEFTVMERALESRS